MNSRLDGVRRVVGLRGRGIERDFWGMWVVTRLLRVNSQLDGVRRVVGRADEGRMGKELACVPLSEVHLVHSLQDNMITGEPIVIQPHSIRRTATLLALLASASLAAPHPGSAAPKQAYKPFKRPAAPSSPKARRLLAIEYVKQAAAAYNRGDYNRTIALCETAADWYPTYARAQVWMGAAYQKKRNYFQARMAYRWAKSLAPGTADAKRAERGLREIGRY